MENLDQNLQYASDDLNAFKAMELLKREKQPVEDTYSEKETIINLIKEKIEQVRAMATEHNLFVNHTGRELAERTIRLGGVLLELKSLVRMSDESWEGWANQNLPFLGKRNRQKYMLLAKRTDCHRHTRLCIDRLEMLCSATKNDSDNGDPIDAFMLRHGITVDEASELDVEEFKIKVDTALAQEKLERRNIQISPELVETATRQGKNFDKALLKKLSNISRNGGDPEAYLRNPSSIRKEKEEAEPPVEVEREPQVEKESEPPVEEEGEPTAPAEEAESELAVKEEGQPQVEDKAKEFKTLADETIQMIEDILKSPDQISKIDRDSLTRLIEKLMELQTAAAMNCDEAEAA